jgi:signal transduction histidine kinase
LRTNLDVVDASEDREDLRELLEDARVQLDRLEALSRSLIDLSRLEAGAEDPVLVPLQLDALLRETIEPAASRAEQAELELELGRLEPTLVSGDEGKLLQAIGNLLDNAIKFTSPGGKIAVSLTGEDGWSVLVVEDTGIGFGDQDPQQLFERFRRGRNSGPYPGSGLGLAIVKVIAEAHGGTAEAVAKPDGSRFVIRLPLAE